MIPDDMPITEPTGELVPPARNPPTALAVATPPPPGGPRAIWRRLQPDARTRKFVDDTIDFIFDRADILGDEIAHLFGVRRRGALTAPTPPTPPAAPTPPPPPATPPVPPT